MPSPAVPCANHPDQLAAATCGRCGDFICAACAHPDGASTLCERCVHSAASGPAPIPWESRGDRGWVAAWWATTWESLLSLLWPVFGENFFGQVGARGGYGPATGYAFVNLGLWLAVGGLTSTLHRLPDLWDVPDSVRWDSGPGVVLVMIPLTVVVMLAATVPLLYVQAALVHTVGMVFGVERGGFRGTFRACAYSTGVWPLTGALVLPLSVLRFLIERYAEAAWFAPLAGVPELLVFLLALLVWGVLIQAALREVHGVSAWRAIGAVLGTLILIAVCSCGLLFGVGVLLGGA